MLISLNLHMSEKNNGKSPNKTTQKSHSQIKWIRCISDPTVGYPIYPMNYPKISEITSRFHESNEKKSHHSLEI